MSNQKKEVKYAMNKMKKRPDGAATPAGLICLEKSNGVINQNMQIYEKNLDDVVLATTQLAKTSARYEAFLHHAGLFRPYA